MKNLAVTILDDDDFILDVTQSMIESIGITDVVTYTSAQQALQSLKLSDVHQVLLCDLNMPEMDGVEVIRILGQSNFVGAIIVLSGEDSRTLQTVVNMGRAYHLRLIGALVKPVKMAELQHMFKLIKSSIAQSKYVDMPLNVRELAAGMEAAIKPYFQPQVDVVSSKVMGVEALARWVQPDGQILAPSFFIPLAEENQLIDRLTDLILTKSLLYWRQWYEAGIDLSLSVNISMHSLNRIDFPDRLVEEMQAIGMPLDRLILEITESHLAEDMRIASDVLTRLCLKRVQLSIDDFGTAYSNMEKLMMVPFSELKIDRAFVHGAAENPSSYAILKSSVDLARRLKMKTVAEGVENQEDWQCVAGLDCDLIQGYFVSRPMLGERVVEWVKSWEKAKCL